MNEAEIENKPVDNDAFSLDLSDFELDETMEDTIEPITEEVDQPVETKETEVDYKPLFDALSGKIKYMDEEVKVESLDDIITNYQKGLDYDRKTKKIDELENSEEMSYIKEIAKESGMTTTEYLKAAKEFREQQAIQQEQAEIDEMVENGIAENIARKVIETNRVAKELEAEKLKIKQEQAEIAKAKEREAENEQFITAYPDIDIKSIPKEVFVDAEKMGLIGAYSKYENAKLKTELDILRKNQQNDKSSPVTSTTEHGSKDIETDEFLRGLLGK